MFPYLFDSSWIGLEGDFHFRLPTYFVAIMLGWGLAVILALRDAQRLGIDRQKFIDFAMWMLIVGVLGSRIAHVLLDGFFMDYVHLCTNPFLVEGKPLSDGAACVANSECLALQDRGQDIGAVCNLEDGLCYPQQDCFRWLKFWAGGLTVYGALIACVGVGWWYMRKFDLPVRKIMDMGGYGIPLGIALGRLGCFAAGCCYGDVCHVDWIAVQFPSGTAAYQDHFLNHYEALSTQWRSGIKTSLPVWPTQLFSSAYNFAIFAFAYFFMRHRKRYDGQVLLVTVLLYAAFRFGVEFLRADPRGAMLGLSTSQLIALGTVAAAGLMLWRLRNSSPPSHNGGQGGP